MATPQSTALTPEMTAMLDRFSDYLYSRRNLAPASIGNYIGTMRRAFPVIGLNPTDAEIDRYMANFRKSRRSGSYATYTAVSIECYMEMIGRPTTLGRPPATKRVLKNVLSEPEITLLIAATETPRNRAMMAVLAYAGVRNEELVKLHIGDVNIADQVIHVAGKGAKERKACVGGACIEALVAYMNERDANAEDWLFVTCRNGTQLEQQDIRKFVKLHAKKAGIRKRVYPHLLRHSLATNLLLRGASLLTIRDQLGHEYLESTMAYLHATRAQLQRDYKHFQPAYM